MMSEYEVLKLEAAGFTLAEIAQQLGVDELDVRAFLWRLDSGESA